jgi:hypothetical protein
MYDMPCSVVLYISVRGLVYTYIYYVKPDICMHAYSIPKNMYKYFISKSIYRNSIPKKYIGIDTPFQKKCIYLQILHSNKYI